MISIIETNLLLDSEGNIRDHQSRIINYSDWNSYINEIKNAECKNHEGTLYGCSIPKFAKIDNLKYDEFHLSCSVTNLMGTYKKYAYLINKQIL